MAGEQAYSIFNYMKSGMEQGYVDWISKYTVVGIPELNDKNSDEEYILASLILGLIENLFSKFTSEMKVMIESYLDTQRVRYKARSDELITRIDGEDLSNRNDFQRPIGSVGNPEIHEITANENKDPKHIAQTLYASMTHFMATEMRNCVLVSKNESYNKGPDEEYIPLSTIVKVMAAMVARFSSDASIQMATMIRKNEDELNAVFVEFRAQMESRAIEKNNLVKQLEDLKKLKDQEIKSKDAVIGVNEFNDASFRDMRISTLDEKKNCSIICKFANRNKKYEILSNRRKAKGTK